MVYDDIGCNETKNSFFKGMIKEDIAVANFTPIKFAKLIWRINYRNHKKIVVIDGKVGYTGGMNVKDEYVKGVSWGVWKDTHVRVEGPGAQALQAAFVIDWYYTKHELLQDTRYFPTVSFSGNVPLQFLTAEPLGNFSHIMMGMMEGITRAKRSVYIETPYFVPTDSIITALQTSALSGVEIHFVLPGRSDNAKVHYATKSYIQQLLCAGIHVYRYQAGFIHSKLMVIDDELTIVGSSNMDIRSFELNFEGSLFIYDQETACKAKEIILKDINDSKLMNEKEWEKRPKRKKFVEAFFRLFSPFM
ncbi:MAG: cardiolipin synthase [Tannerellaceae bacterium]|nr:cardiolipin synthase [Tannerellaceae bacterium]